MKKIFVLLCLLSLFLLTTKAQNYEDVVYLKNGSIIRGLIIEQIPNQTIKIQTKDRNVFVFNIPEIEKITKEEIQNISKTNNPDYRKAGAAFAFSILYPGGGQIYNRQYLKGGIMMGLETIGLATSIVGAKYYGIDRAFVVVSIILTEANQIWSLIDAPVSTAAINRRNGLSLKYDTNKNIRFALKPDYQITNINGNFYPVYGAKLSFSFN